MNKSILVIDTPSSCSECKIVSGVSSGGGMIIWQCPFEDEYSHEMAYNFTDKKLPNCPLISISIDELEEAIYVLSSNIDLSLLIDNAMNEEESIVSTTLKREKEIIKSNAINTIKSTIDKLGGKR